LNAELTKKALKKVGNPNVLVNLMSRGVRQLTSGGGGSNHPLISEAGNRAAADIAWTEIVAQNMRSGMPQLSELTGAVGTNRRRN
jgi:hypothetical protein